MPARITTRVAADPRRPSKRKHGSIATIKIGLADKNLVAFEAWAARRSTSAGYAFEMVQDEAGGPWSITGSYEARNASRDMFARIFDERGLGLRLTTSPGSVSTGLVYLAERPTIEFVCACRNASHGTACTDDDWKASHLR